MKKHNYSDYIQDMVDSIDKILSKTNNITCEELKDDDTLSLAIERLFEILGEAANRLPKDLQAKYPDIPWSDIVGMRNIIIHAYDKVDPDIIWNAIKLRLPEFRENLTKMLAEVNNG